MLSNRMRALVVLFAACLGALPLRAATTLPEVHGEAFIVVDVGTGRTWLEAK